MSRVIGIRHRIKRTTKGEAHPTQVAIVTVGKKPQVFDLKDEQAELDFLNGKYPIKWKVVLASEVTLTDFLPHHIVVEDEDHVKVPIKYIGLQSGDEVAMSLGGSGDYFAFALSLHGEKIGAKVYRIPPAKLKVERGNLAPDESGTKPLDEDESKPATKNEDAVLLTKIFIEKRELFMETSPRDRGTIELRMRFTEIEEARKDRIACLQRLQQRLIGEIFCTPLLYEAGNLDRLLREAKANNLLLKFLEREEDQCTKEVEELLEAMPIYRDVLSKVKGTGPKTMVRILAHVGDVRRFSTVAKFKAYCGVHLMKVITDGGEEDFVFPRRRKSVVSNWQPDCRQGFYLLVQGFIKSKDSEWGQKFLQYKEHFRAKHPEPVKQGNRTLYTKMHIHQMAIHRTMTKFAEWMYREWVKLEAQQPVGV